MMLFALVFTYLSIFKIYVYKKYTKTFLNTGTKFRPAQTKANEKTKNDLF